MPNYYDELEVSPKASLGTIRAAYRALIQRYHPDRNPANRESALRTQRLNDAYAELSEPERRASYDAKLATEARLHREQEEARRRNANEAAARAQAATAELRRELEARARAQKAAETENERRRQADRDESPWVQREARHKAEAEEELRGQQAMAVALEQAMRVPDRAATTAAQTPEPQRYETAKPAPSGGGFVRGVGKFFSWGIVLWIAATVWDDATKARTSQPKSVAAATATLSQQAKHTLFCRMWMGDELVAGDISVDFRANTVDGEPARISGSTVSYRRKYDAGELLNNINWRTGVLTTTYRDKTGRASNYSGQCMAVTDH